MTCSRCSSRAVPSFPTEAAYVDHKKRLGALVADGELRQLSKVPTSDPFYRMYYECTACRQEWVLEVPDQAFRGSYRPFGASKVPANAI